MNIGDYMLFDWFMWEWLIFLRMSMIDMKEMI